MTVRLVASPVVLFALTRLGGAGRMQARKGTRAMLSDGIDPTPPARPRASAGLADGLRLRVVGAAVAGPCLAVLLTASLLEPRSGGLGTHRSLGLPACSILARTGYPCPSCGMTTSIAAAAHGRLGEALQAQPAGLLWFAALVVLASAGVAQAVVGWPALRRVRWGWWWPTVAVAAMLVGWVAKLAIMAQAGQLPVR